MDPPTVHPSVPAQLAEVLAFSHENARRDEGGEPGRGSDGGGEDAGGWGGGGEWYDGGYLLDEGEGGSYRAGGLSGYGGGDGSWHGVAEAVRRGGAPGGGGEGPATSPRAGGGWRARGIFGRRSHRDDPVLGGGGRGRGGADEQVPGSYDSPGSYGGAADGTSTGYGGLGGYDGARAYGTDPEGGAEGDGLWDGAGEDRSGSAGGAGGSYERDPETFLEALEQQREALEEERRRGAAGREDGEAWEGGDAGGGWGAGSAWGGGDAGDGWAAGRAGVQEGAGEAAGLEGEPGSAGCVGTADTGPDVVDPPPRASPPFWGMRGDGSGYGALGGDSGGGDAAEGAAPSFGDALAPISTGRRRHHKGGRGGMVGGGTRTDAGRKSGLGGRGPSGPVSGPGEGGAAAHRRPKGTKKTLAVRRWLSVDQRGSASVLELGKLKVTHQLGVQLRDLRLLDPLLSTSYPSAILARDRAFVLNLEFIKAIVTTQHVLVTNLESPSTITFVEELQRRLSEDHARAEAAREAAEQLQRALLRDLPGVAAARAAASGDEGGGDGRTTAFPGTLGAAGGNSAALAADPLTWQPASGGLAPAPAFPSGPSFGADPLQNLPPAIELPFELRALEVALEAVCGYMGGLASELESAAHPALDALTAGVDTTKLESVRRLKTRLVRLTTRVETVREVLEKFLDDDSDMKDLHLSKREADRLESLARASARAEAWVQAASTAEAPGGGALAPSPATLAPGTPRRRSRKRHALAGGALGVPPALGPTDGAPSPHPLAPLAGALGTPPPSHPSAALSRLSPAPPSPGSSSFRFVLGAMPGGTLGAPGTPRFGPSQAPTAAPSSASTDSSDEEVEEVERLLEPYFLQLDVTRNRLRTLCEYIEDTEDYVGIELDAIRNELFRLDLVLTAVTASVATIIAVTSLFAMNVELRPNKEGQGPYSWFLAISLSCCLSAVGIFCAIIGYCRKKRLI